MAVLNFADKIYLNGQEVDRVYLNDEIVYDRSNLYQLFKDRVLADSGTFLENPIDFNNEKLLLTPNAYKENKLYSVIPIDGSGDFAFSRNSSATYNEDGIVKTALPNVPRIQDGKILIEGQATNILLYANDITNSRWHKQTGITYVGGYADAFGTNTAFKVSSTNLSGIFSFGAYSGGVMYRIVILKGVIGGEVVEIKDPVKTNNILSITLTNQWAIYKLYEDNTNITAAGIWINKIPPAGIMFCGASITEIESSYIPTNGTAVTRLADIATVTPPTGVTEIIETIDGVEQAPITTIPSTYQLPVGEIDNVKMI